MAEQGGVRLGGWGRPGSHVCRGGARVPPPASGRGGGARAGDRDHRGATADPAGGVPAPRDRQGGRGGGGGLRAVGLRRLLRGALGASGGRPRDVGQQACSRGSRERASSLTRDDGEADTACLAAGTIPYSPGGVCSRFALGDSQPGLTLAVGSGAWGWSAASSSII